VAASINHSAGSTFTLAGRSSPKFPSTKRPQKRLSEAKHFEEVSFSKGGGKTRFEKTQPL